MSDDKRRLLAEEVVSTTARFHSLGYAQNPLYNDRHDSQSALHELTSSLQPTIPIAQYDGEEGTNPPHLELLEHGNADGSQDVNSDLETALLQAIDKQEQEQEKTAARGSSSVSQCTSFVTSSCESESRQNTLD